MQCFCFGGATSTLDEIAAPRAFTLSPLSAQQSGRVCRSRWRDVVDLKWLAVLVADLD
jgi:hypothetical protein